MARPAAALRDAVSGRCTQLQDVATLRNASGIHEAPLRGGRVQGCAARPVAVDLSREAAPVVILRGACDVVGRAGLWGVGVLAKIAAVTVAAAFLESAAAGLSRAVTTHFACHTAGLRLRAGRKESKGHLC